MCQKAMVSQISRKTRSFFLKNHCLLVSVKVGQFLKKKHWFLTQNGVTCIKK